MSLPTLYKLDKQWDDLMELAELEPDLDLADTIEGLTGTREQKREAVAYFLENLAVLAKARRDAAKQMVESARDIEARKERLTQYLVSSMRKYGITEIACPEFTAKLHKNPPSVHIDNADIVPLQYQEEVTEYKIRKKDIKAAIDAGEEVPGAHIERDNYRLKVT